MIHRHRVPLFAFQSFLCSFDALAHLRASLPLKCKYNAHLRLSTTITTLVVYQAGLCPQVWCCLIHHKGFSLLDSSENYPLMCASCHHPSRLSTSHELAQLKQYFSSICYYQPFWNCQVIQTWISYLAVKRAHRCKLNVLLHGFFSACQIRSWKEMCWHHQWCSSPIFIRWSAHLSFKTNGPTVSLSGCSLPTFIQMRLCDNIVQKS